MVPQGVWGKQAMAGYGGAEIKWRALQASGNGKIGSEMAKLEKWAMRQRRKTDTNWESKPIGFAPAPHRCSLWAYFPAGSLRYCPYRFRPFLLTILPYCAPAGYTIYHFAILSFIYYQKLVQVKYM